LPARNHLRIMVEGRRSSRGRIGVRNVSVNLDPASEVKTRCMAASRAKHQEITMSPNCLLFVSDAARESWREIFIDAGKVS